MNLDSIVYIISNHPYLLSPLIIILIDMIMGFRYYHMQRYMIKSEEEIDENNLKSYIDIAISGYRTLSSEKEINKVITKVRELEDKLGKTPHDFSKHIELYKKQINEANLRGYV